MAPITRILLTAFAVITVIIGAGVYLSVQKKDTPAAAQAGGGEVGQLVRDNSRRLNNAPDSDVTLVEFLDFECEACRAAFPMVEQARSEYGGDRVNFVIRYFPIPSHFNAERAARAVESAAQQGKFEPMYKKMYETQSQWGGEQRTPADSTFRASPPNWDWTWPRSTPLTTIPPRLTVSMWTSPTVRPSASRAPRLSSSTETKWNSEATTTCRRRLRKP